jgi:hypothetical protein
VAVGRLDWSQINKGGGEVRINDLGCQGEPMPRPRGGRGRRGSVGGCCWRRKPKKEVKTKEDDRQRVKPIENMWRPIEPVTRRTPNKIAIAIYSLHS